MNLASTLRAHTRVALATVASAALLAAGATAATATPSPDVRPAPSAKLSTTPQPSAPAATASATAATIPSTCVGIMHRTVGGDVSRYLYEGQRFTRIPIGQISFGGSIEQPKTMALVISNEANDIYLAVRTNGSLWRVVLNDNGLTASQVSASGWGGVRHLTGTYDATRVYALTTSGGLYRYSLTSNGTPRSLGAIATTGWGGIKFLSPSASDDSYDGVIGVSSVGALRQYVIDRATGETFGGSLKASGWGAITHISTGGCDNSNAMSLIGFTAAGDAFGYYDANAYDLNGSDIRGVGKTGFGFSGLLTD